MVKFGEISSPPSGIHLTIRIVASTEEEDEIYFGTFRFQIQVSPCFPKKTLFFGVGVIIKGKKNVLRIHRRYQEVRRRRQRLPRRQHRVPLRPRRRLRHQGAVGHRFEKPLPDRNQ